MANTLILLGLVLTVLVIVGSFTQYRKNRNRLSKAKYMHYCATGDDLVYVDYSADVDLSTKHVSEIALVAVIVLMLGYGVVNGYYEYQSGADIGNEALMWFFVVIWFFFVALFWRTLIALRDLLRERALYMRARGKEIALKGDDLFLSLVLFDGPGRDLLRLHNRPYFRIPLKEVTAFRADPMPPSEQISTQDYVQVCFEDNPEGYHISRIYLEPFEKDLLPLIKDKLKVPVEL